MGWLFLALSNTRFSTQSGANSVLHSGDVAQLAEVSTATVSRVMNGAENVSSDKDLRSYLRFQG